jgi:hypothetical protein
MSIRLKRIENARAMYWTGSYWSTRKEDAISFAREFDAKKYFLNRANVIMERSLLPVELERD